MHTLCLVKTRIIYTNGKIRRCNAAFYLNISTYICYFATKVSIGKLPATGGVWVIIG